LNKSNISGVLLHASLKGDNDILRQWNHFVVQQTNSEASLLSALLQSTLFRAYCITMYIVQLWCKQTQSVF